MLRKAWVLGILVTVSGHANAADANTNDFLLEYDRAGGPARVVFERYVSGMEQGLLWANAELATTRKQKQFYCQPVKLTMTGPQIVEMIRKGVSEDATLGKAPVGYTVMAVLARTFPCD